MFRHIIPISERLVQVVVMVSGLVAVGFVEARVTEPTAIFGSVFTTIQGSGVNGGVTYLGPSLVEKPLQEVRLEAGPPWPNQLKGVGAAWAPGVFDVHPEENSHYIEIKSSLNAEVVGLMSDIVSHTSNTLTIADDLSGVLRGGEVVVIRAHKTLEGIFGATNQAGLGGGDASTADLISILTEGPNASFRSYYYRSGIRLGGAGWRSSSNPFVDQGKTPLKTGQGLLIKRKRLQPVVLRLSGYVKTGVWRRSLPGGYALVDPLAPLTDQTQSTPVSGPAFTLGGTGTGAISSGLGAALTPGTPQTADLVSLAGTMASFYVATAGGLSSGGWRQTSNPMVDKKLTVIPPATSILIQNRGQDKSWWRPQPFTVGPR